MEENLFREKMATILQSYVCSSFPIQLKNILYNSRNFVSL